MSRRFAHEKFAAHFRHPIQVGFANPPPPPKQGQKHYSKGLWRGARARGWDDLSWPPIFQGGRRSPLGDGMFVCLQGSYDVLIRTSYRFPFPILKSRVLLHVSLKCMAQRSHSWGQDVTSLFEGQQIHTRNGREVCGISSWNSELQCLLVFGDVECLRKQIPKSEDIAEILVPVFLIHAVMDLMLSWTNEQSAHDRPIRKPNVRMSQSVTKQEKPKYNYIHTTDR